jgi:hypothetical protein
LADAVRFANISEHGTELLAYRCSVEYHRSLVRLCQ